MPRNCSATSPGPNGLKRRCSTRSARSSSASRPRTGSPRSSPSSAVRRDEQHAGELRSTSEHGEQVTCRPIGPVDVLDDQHHGFRLGHPAQRRPQRVGRSGVGVGVIAELGEHLVDRGVRSCALGDVEALPGEHDRAGRFGALTQLGDKARLTDSRVTADEHGHRGPGDRCFEGDDQVPQLLVSSDEPRTRHP